MSFWASTMPGILAFQREGRFSRLISPDLRPFTSASPVSVHRSRHCKSPEKQVAMIAQKVMDANQAK